MRITSPAFLSNQPIPSQFTCDGKDISPTLRFEGVPKGAKTLALIVDDPDSSGKPWVHWTLWNIDPDLKEIPEGSVPEGAVQGVNDFGTIRWGGPCPPAGKAHHYRFKGFALSVRLPLTVGASLPDLEKAMDGKVIERAEWVGTYRRSR